MLSEDVLVESLSLVILMESLIKTCQVVCCGHRDGAVVRLIMTSLLARSVK